MSSNVFNRMNELGAERVPFLFAIDFEGEKPLCYRLDDIAADEVLYAIGRHCNFTRQRPIRDYEWKVSPMLLDDYAALFYQVQQELRYGNTFLLNLTARTSVETSLSPCEIIRCSNQRYNLWVKDRFAVFSPEPFVCIVGNQLSTYPMKGTSGYRSGWGLESLLANEKEHKEHATVVDLLRNDLSQVGRGTLVKRFRYVESIETSEEELLQVSSEIVTHLDKGWQGEIGNIFQKLLPAGSVSGAPKQKTVGIIRDVEQQPRGYYTGVAGIFDGMRLESFVMIRFIEITPQQLYFRSGGGITSDSVMEDEYKELLQKVYLPF